MVTNPLQEKEITLPASLYFTDFLRIQPRGKSEFYPYSSSQFGSRPKWEIQVTAYSEAIQSGILRKLQFKFCDKLKGKSDIRLDYFVAHIPPFLQ